MTATTGRDADTARLTALASVVAVALSVWWKATHLELPEAYTLAGYSDVSALFGARDLASGGLPYVDLAIEYPPGIGLTAWMLAQPVGTPVAYLVLNGVLLAAAAGVTAWLLAREVGWPRSAALLAGPVVVVAAAVNWDLLSVVFATAGLVAHRRSRDVAAGAWLGLGVATKLWPGLVLLAVVVATWRLRGTRAAAGTAGVAALAWAVLNVPVMLASWSGWYEFVELSRSRPADWDSLWRLLGNAVGSVPTPETLNTWVGALTVAGVVAVLAATMRRLPATRWHEAALALVAVFLLAGKVYSPQFTLWLLPLLALAWPGWGWVAAFSLADVAVHVTRFRYLGGFVGDGLEGAWPEWPFATAVVVRDLLLLACIAAWWHRATTDDDAVESRGRPVAAV